MKVKPGFNIRNVCGENIIVPEGEENIDFGNIISMNESSSYLWNKVKEMDSFTIDDMVRLLQEEYEVDRNTAYADCETLASQWGYAEIITGDDIPVKEIEKKTTSKPKSQPEEPKKKSFLSRIFGK